MGQLHSDHASQDTFRSDLCNWAQPLIMDQINHFYFSHLRGRWELARDLSIAHYRIWRHVMKGESDAASRERRLHDLALQAAGLDPHMAQEADHLVLDELMDVIVTRFQRTPSLARGYGQSLLDTATRLAQIRPAA